MLVLEWRSGKIIGVRLLAREGVGFSSGAGAKAANVPFGRRAIVQSKKVHAIPNVGSELTMALLSDKGTVPNFGGREKGTFG